MINLTPDTNDDEKDSVIMKFFSALGVLIPALYSAFIVILCLYGIYLKIKS